MKIGTQIKITSIPTQTPPLSTRLKKRSSIEIDRVKRQSIELTQSPLETTTGDVFLVDKPEIWSVRLRQRSSSAGKVLQRSYSSFELDDSSKKKNSTQLSKVGKLIIQSL